MNLGITLNHLNTKSISSIDPSFFLRLYRTSSKTFQLLIAESICVENSEKVCTGQMKRADVKRGYYVVLSIVVRMGIASNATREAVHTLFTDSTRKVNARHSI